MNMYLPVLTSSADDARKKGGGKKDVRLVHFLMATLSICS